MTRSAVICNPTKVADTGRLRAEVAAVLDDAGWPAPAWFETTVTDPGRDLARQAVADGSKVVFACGGDGTVRACVSALAGTDAALAIVPKGTANLLARHLRLPSDATAAVRAATAGKRRRIDVGRVDGQCFTVAAGLGFDADLLADAPENLKQTIGWPAYLVSAFRHLHGRRFRVEVRIDDRPPRRHLVRGIVVVNVDELPGGLGIAPAARVDDGRLDLVVLAPRGIGDWLGVAYRTLRRRPHRRLLTFTAAEIDVQVRRRRVSRQLDGDLLDRGKRLHVRVDAAAVEVCVP